jgi:predicted nucleic acid-binding protein
VTATLPRRAALDSSFLINLHKRDPDSVKALQRLETAKSKLVLAEIVWAEMEVGPGGASRIPHHLEFLEVSFDREAARHLTRNFPTKKLKTYPGDRDVWKFDALILACALAGRADAIVTNNPSDFRTLIDDAGLKIDVFTARQLLDPQLDMFDEMSAGGDGAGTPAADASPLPTPATPEPPVAPAASSPALRSPRR